LSHPANSQSDQQDDITILVPVFNDWPALSRLLRELDSCLATVPCHVRVWIVDDCSTQPPTIDIPAGGFQCIESVTRLPMRRNLGHQRAIAMGLTYLHQHQPFGAVVVMDADGEDKPEDVPRLLKRYRETEGATVVFAARARRSERLVYRMGYRAYQLLSIVMTGKTPRVGNFSIISFDHVDQLVTVSELWNHYAAAIHSAGIPRTTIPTTRGKRYSGTSSMDYPRWVAHGMAAMSVFSAVVGARLLLIHFILFLLIAGAMLGLLACQGGASLAGVVIAGILFAQGSLILFALVIVLLGERDKQSFLPIRDYAHFVRPPQKVHPREESV
jgi:polyisoprenyl-phosphate glycosyltransferase